ncbi:ATP-binding protein [Suttonella sp. R2A3]|uniref:sensor histidine kinase n=1 Tax=Suttonella sp. R2A3 TaxID=2908648 RepID=UPI001F285460|nr:ATP-binding protein [Suttonella sp. R2A3]UJF24264.1 ATP-binding protein [Suttonella sp. R2A3]
MGISALICWWLSRYLSRHIQRLRQAVRQIAEGDYQAAEPLVNVRSDELGELGNDIAQMATQLCEHQRARKQMLSDIAHELRSPLARMDVAIALAQEKAPQATQHLTQISKESVRMNALVGHIIHIQQAGLHQQDDAQRVNLTTLLRQLCDDLRYEGRERGCTVVLNIAETLTTYANPERLASALENILRNALAHSPDGGVIEVAVQADVANINISISDQGSGVAEADLARIFMPFVRLDGSRTRKTGGYGLGLAIAKAVIVDELAGKLSACNRETPEQGLHIMITLVRG